MKHSRARSPEAIRFARTQRRVANEFAQTIWQWIRNRQICGQKFRREYPIPPDTADFCCVELKLIMEIDGAGHVTEGGRERDRVRDEMLARQGYRVVRIAGYDVLQEPGRVLERIEEQVRERMRELNRSSPGTSPRGGKGETDERELALPSLPHPHQLKKS